jgi:REP element-mobilizing transposase RayT
MHESERLPHPLWEGKSPLVFIPPYRRKVLCAARRTELGAVFRDRARPKDWRSAEGHLQPEPVPRVLSSPPQYAVAGLGGDRQGKSALPRARP